MATTTKTIIDYASAGSTDAVNDYFLGYNAAATAYRKYNRNTLLGITGAPVGTTDTQTLSGKTLTSPTINGATLSGTLSGTYTLGGTPTFPSSVVTLTGSQTLLNKTLTSPAISGGSISNATIAVDSISGFSTSTIVTVAGVQMNNGTIATAGAVTSTSVAVGAIQPQALVSGTGTGWAWTAFTPFWTNLTPGNGTNVGYYTQIGKTVIVQLSMTFGTTSSMGTQPTVTLPVTATSAGLVASISIIGQTGILDAGTAQYTGQVIYGSTTTAILLVGGAGGTFLGPTTITSTIPQTWASSDILSAQFIYQAA